MKDDAARKARRSPVRRLGVGLALAACITTFLGGCAADQAGGAIELKFGHVGAPGSLYDLVAHEFADRVNERLAGQAHMVVFGSSQLGSDEVMLQKLKLGTLDLSLPSTAMSSAVDAFGLFEMPYLVQDRDNMRRLEEAIVWPDLAPLAEADGYRVLAVWENGFRHITNNERPIRGPADLQGIKLRTPRGIWRVKLFQALGANPTPMPFSEVFIALQTGVMDGQENPLAQIVSAKLHEVQTYLSMSSHVYTPAFLTAGVNRWNRLPVEVTAAVEEVARGMQPFVYEHAIRMDEELLAELVAAGVEVNEVDHDAFRAAGQAIYDEFGSTVTGGQALLDKAIPLARP